MSENLIDVVLSVPISEFSELYRLVDVSAVRDVRVNMPAVPGFEGDQASAIAILTTRKSSEVQPPQPV